MKPQPPNILGLAFVSCLMAFALPIMAQEAKPPPRVLFTKEGVWLSFQPFTKCSEPNFTPLQNAKQAIVCQGTAHLNEPIKAMPKLKVVHGTDIVLNPPDGNKDEMKQMDHLLKWSTPFEILKMSTSNVGEMLKLSGPRNPYPGDLGVVKQGAYADLLLVEGNPFQHLKAVTERDNLKIIMKDGKISKNTLM